MVSTPALFAQRLGTCSGEGNSAWALRVSLHSLAPPGDDLMDQRALRIFDIVEAHPPPARVGRALHKPLAIGKLHDLAGKGHILRKRVLDHALRTVALK